MAAVLAILIVGYSGFLGTRYFSASSHVGSLNARAMRSDSRGGSSSEIARQTLQQHQELLRERLESSQYTKNELITLISDTAEKTNVSVVSTNLDAAGEEIVGQFRYGTQPVRLSLAGGAENAEPASTTTSIIGFLAFLGDEMPLSIKSLSLARLSDEPVVDATLIFYLSVATTSPEE